MTTAAPTVDYVIGRIVGDPDGFRVPAPGHGLPHLLVSGETGSGKSSTIAKLLKGLSADPRVALYGIDFKAGLELHPWAPRFTAIAQDHEHAGPLLDWLVDQIAVRAETIKQASADEGRTIRNWRDQMGPRYVIVIDEMSMVDKDELAAIKDIAARGRALGYTLVCCTQYALANRFDTDFLNNLSGRICHRMAGPTQYAVALRTPEKHLEEAGWSPISIETPGICFVTGIPGLDDMTRARSRFVSDEVIDDWVPQVAHLRWPATTE